MEEGLELPPGFRFHPTDLELVSFYLSEKLRNDNFNPVAIGEANLNSIEPWDLRSLAKMGEKEMYFFCKREKRYPTGSRTNRATVSGYWKATGKDKEIFQGDRPNTPLGMKKTLVFYEGRAPKGKKTDWVMHEYRLESKSTCNKDEWVVCRVFHKGSGSKPSAAPELERVDSFGYLLSSADDFSSYETKVNPIELNNHSNWPQNYWTSFQNQDYTFDSQEQAKVEQHPNLSFASASQETGLSTDINTETSSVVSRSYEEFAGLWDY